MCLHLVFAVQDLPDHRVRRERKETLVQEGHLVPKEDKERMDKKVYTVVAQCML